MLAILPVYVLAVGVEVGFGGPTFILKFIKAPQLRLETQQTEIYKSEGGSCWSVVKYPRRQTVLAI